MIQPGQGMDRWGTIVTAVMNWLS